MMISVDPWAFAQRSASASASATLGRSDMLFPNTGAVEIPIAPIQLAHPFDRRVM